MKKYFPLILALSLSVIAILSRFLPHPPNFTAIGAVALFSGIYLSRRWSFVVPFAILFVTDIVLGFYEPAVMASVYLSFVLVGIIGRYVSKQKNAQNIFMGAISVSLIFFIVTNFAVWAFTPWYAKTISGLLQSYTLAVPFFRNMLLGDIFYVAALCGLYEGVIRLSQVCRTLNSQKV